MTNMKIMIAGKWRWPIYEKAFSHGLMANNVEVHPFTTVRFFDGLLGKKQSALPVRGPALLKLNRRLLEEAESVQPDWILFWRPTHILPSTLRTLTAKGINLVSYNNDDPFGPRKHANVPWHHHLLWRNYLACLPHFDKNFFYRQINCKEALDCGAKHADLLLPYFIPWRDRPVDLTPAEREQYGSDLVFVGHYENDSRVDYIHSLHESGLNIKISGDGSWRRDALGDLYDDLGPISPADGESYVKTLNGAKICLVFLSRLNRDTYTRRCFEIPACKSVMLAERTDDLMELFAEDEEACFFSSSDELVEKANRLLNDGDKRAAIANAAYRRVWSDSHDIESRVKQFLSLLNA